MQNDATLGAPPLAYGPHAVGEALGAIGTAGRRLRKLASGTARAARSLHASSAAEWAVRFEREAVA
jgi:hypothetical protein